MTSASSKPTCLRLDTARSVHFEAQTPLSALCHGAPAGRGAPSDDMAPLTAASSLSGRANSSTMSLRTSGHLPCSASSWNSSLSPWFAGSLRTSSKTPKGTVALGGTAYSLPLGLSSDRCTDFPPRLLLCAKKSDMGRTRQGGAGGLLTASFPPEETHPVSASVAALPSLHVAAVHATSPLGPMDTDMLVPAFPLRSSRRASSSQLASRTLWLRARIATCESTSTA
mmetsp:Transcript_13393/g.40117  ORF Transcript_13393/g.40117 Transcript_13393/m.40117 type:complete len:226 (+) Transcript_13393:792-1469(+)